MVSAVRYVCFFWFVWNIVSNVTLYQCVVLSSLSIWMLVWGFNIDAQMMKNVLWRLYGDLLFVLCLYTLIQFSRCYGERDDSAVTKIKDTLCISRDSLWGSKGCYTCIYLALFLLLRVFFCAMGSSTPVSLYHVPSLPVQWQRFMWSSLIKLDVLSL